MTLRKDKSYNYFYYTPLNDNRGLICTEFVQFLGFGLPSEQPPFITIYASPNRIHRKGCHKIGRKQHDDYVWIDGKRNCDICWHDNLENMIRNHGLGDTFYIRVIEAKKA